MKYKSKKIFLAVLLGMGVLICGNPSYAGRVLQKGMNGDDVKDLQNKLKEANYYDYKVTGYFGDITEKAVEDFQKSKGIAIDGVVGTETKTCLGIENSQDYTERVLKEGMRGNDVEILQNKLKEAGCYNDEITGYFGYTTKIAVKDYQRSQGIGVDGIVGNETKIKLGIHKGIQIGVNGDKYYKGTWFEGGNQLFAIGKEASIYDIDTGKTFNVKRTFGANHADCETLTKEDSEIMKEVVGGYWNWNRRAIILTVDGVKIPASMIGMPHAGLDSKPALAYVSGRSGGFGTGTNLDSIKGNGIDGHFCVHLLGSRTHASNRVEPQHQAMVKKATKVLEGN